MTIPEWGTPRLHAAIAKAKAEWPRDYVSPVPYYRPGDLVVIRSLDGQLRRFAVIIRIDPNKVLRIQLVTNQVEMASDLDMFITTLSDYPTPLIAQPELFGPVWEHQVVRTVGHIGAENAERLGNGLRTQGESLEPLSGLPLGGRHCGRRRFKEDELDDLQELVKECRRSLSWGWR